MFRNFCHPCFVCCVEITQIFNPFVFELVMKTFKINLPSDSKYPYLLWREDLDTAEVCFYDCCETVWVSVDKLIYYAGNNANIHTMILDANSWDKEKRESYIWGINPFHEDGLLRTPRVFFHDSEREVIKSRFFGLWRKRTLVKHQYVGFINGRHRTRIAEFLGAKTIPVQVNKDNAEVLKKYCS
ncbi:hypothetical protein I6Y99_005035 [Vibrio parahaemolyticus]|uniref:hypothetical protein n=1 Tax=Vibrio parahaemolyticus TaxID=670 RepID=UPI0011204DED|nr:hypothetical protein [Vibrio parahaemolyticus]EGQ7796230.1 hypothetical protein [Vibrio parahaemolyticus]EGQ7810965.1 hypothetical protein [Vibrio parahaemolyticus]EGQ8535946.1 hypothetical protein [Vibrio parahaemolyticus]EHR5321348.1 hypothetical protein [Vibrio parahaemolyticus]EJB8505195.1 hypothetical protein [Vibrio parahaemolyticus]